MKHRRAFAIATVCSLVAPGALRAQRKPARIGWLSSSPYTGSPLWAVFIDAMRERGFVEGRDYSVEHRTYDGHAERLPALAAELVRAHVDVIVAAGTPPALAARDATPSIPIVFFYVGDPVGSGLVASLARPGGNLTGTGGLGQGIYAKMLELLHEAAPKATRIAMLINPALSLHTGFRAEIEAVARGFGMMLRPIELRTPDAIDAAFAAVARERAEALLILGQPFLFTHAERIAKLAIAQRLPAIAPFADVAKAGVLMSFGSQLADDVRRLPHFIVRILKGARPSELPVEQATRFYLTLNLRTAQAIGITMTPSVLLRADEVIE